MRTSHFDEHLRSLKEVSNTLAAEEGIDAQNSKFVVLEDHFRVIGITVKNNGQIVQVS